MPDWFTAVLPTVGVVVTAAATWLVARTQGKASERVAQASASVTTQTASAATVQAAAEAWQEIATRTQDRLDDTQGRLDEVEQRLAAISREQHDQAEHSRLQDATIADLRRVLGAWAALWRDLVDRWDTHRAQPHPPPLPPDMTFDEPR